MATKYVVTGEQKERFHNRRWELERQLREGALDPQAVLDGLQLLIEGKKVMAESEAAVTSESWIADILIRELQCHLDFFGQEFGLSEFVQTLQKYGRQKIMRWQKLGLEPHFLPKVRMMKEDNYPGWKIKPNGWFYQQVAEGQILRNINGELVEIGTVALEGITVLIDTRLKPAFNSGKQMYANDNLLGPFIKKLRKEDKIARYKYGPQDSRFGVSTDEWENQIKPVLSQKFGLDQNQLRLERAIEANVIPQLYPYLPRKDDGRTKTQVWYEEYFEGRDSRLYGGDSDGGGLANVDYGASGGRWCYWSVRPLAVL